MNEQQIAHLREILTQLKMPPWGIWDVSDMEMFEFDGTTPLETIEAFLHQHPDAVGMYDEDMIDLDKEWHIMGWMLAGMPTKQVGKSLTIGSHGVLLDDLYDFSVMRIADVQGARKLLFNLAR
jgi:hypothetical protein